MTQRVSVTGNATILEIIVTRSDLDSELIADNVELAVFVVVFTVELPPPNCHHAGLAGHQLPQTYASVCSLPNLICFHNKTHPNVVHP